MKDGLTSSSRRRTTREGRGFHWWEPCSGPSGGPAPACWSQARSTSSSECSLEKKREKSNRISIIDNISRPPAATVWIQVPHLVSWLKMRTKRQRWLFFGRSLCLYGCGPWPDHNTIISLGLPTTHWQKRHLVVWRVTHLEVGGVDLLLLLLLLLGFWFSSEHQLVGWRTKKKHIHCWALEKTCQLRTLPLIQQTKHGEQWTSPTFSMIPDDAASVQILQT